ncbi:hypothetical protein BKA70DRAFT_1107191 [Coprinopsis sp. MPI-PUGE-AT-0042]|nr:hypothetical protein BKA70DRAFT_1107191 [Coprinopsis sp. MPI-PUGE-AT-0042]
MLFTLDLERSREHRSYPSWYERLRLTCCYRGPSDTFVHHGRHFGRSIFAFANVHSLISKGLTMEAAPSETSPSLQERREYRVWRLLCDLIPTLEETVMQPGTTPVLMLSPFMRRSLMKGTACARADDTKSMKGPILEWITPKGETLVPSIHRNQKAGRGFNHNKMGELLCPVTLDWSDGDVKEKLKNKEITMDGTQWPRFVYENGHFDPQDPWKGLLRSALLVMAFRHIFTSPSSVDEDPRLTRSGNARIHGMTKVTATSIAYVATQVRFALSSASTFSRSNRETDSETFYTSILEILEDADEKEEADCLLEWWNKAIFPSFSTACRAPDDDTPYALIRACRKAMKASRPLNTITNID